MKTGLIPIRRNFTGNTISRKGYRDWARRTSMEITMSLKYKLKDKPLKQTVGIILLLTIQRYLNEFSVYSPPLSHRAFIALSISLLFAHNEWFLSTSSIHRHNANKTLSLNELSQNWLVFLLLTLHTFNFTAPLTAENHHVN